jgi:peroxin-14
MKPVSKRSCLQMILLASTLGLTNKYPHLQVSSAVRFLQNPKVSSSPLQQKRDFLISKGLTNQEVDLACQRVGVSTVTSHEHMTSPPQNHVIATIPTYPVQTFQGPRWLQNFRDFLHFVVLLGGAAYGCYYLWRVSIILNAVSSS